MQKQRVSQKNNKLMYIIMSVLLFLFDIYLALSISSMWDKTLPVIDRINKLSEMTFSPSQISLYNAFHNNIDVFFVCFFLFLFVVFCFILSMLTKKEYMTNNEYGDARWGNISQINAKYSSKKPYENRVYSRQLRIGMDGDKTRINSNTIVVGGSGVGKSLFLLTPNLYNACADTDYPGSFVITDPDGSLLRNTGMLLKEIGYRVRTVNLISGKMDESDRFNPMMYIRNQTDALKLAAVIFANTQKPGEHSNDPFFDNQAQQLLSSLILLVHMEHQRFGWENNFNTVLDLINMADASDEGSSELDEIFERLNLSLAHEKENIKKHQAYKLYKKATRGATDTVLSIISSLNARIGIFDNEEVRRIFSGDDIDLKSIGTGIVGNSKNRKTALFLCIPDADSTFNAVAGMVYTLLIQELYFQADNVYGGKLPVPVSFWFDEFANIALPADFPKIIATMRKRRMSVVILIQNIAQLEEIYKGKAWENIVGNCDTFVYLGGNEPSTFKYISENLGKRTIWKKSNGRSYGSHGSTSTNDDILARELMLPSEVRELDNDYCIVLVRSQKPVLDYKYDTLNDPVFQHSKSLGVYVHSKNKEKPAENLIVEEIKNDGNLDVEINLDEDLIYRHPELEELYNIVIDNEMIEESKKKIDIADISLVELLSSEDFTKHITEEQLIEIKAAIANGLTDEEIKSFILYDSAETMKQKRLLIEAIKVRTSK